MSHFIFKNSSFFNGLCGLGSDRLPSSCNLTWTPPSFLDWLPIVLPALSHFCWCSNTGLDGAVTPLTHSITDTWCISWELHTSPGFPNLMANKGDIHLAVSEIVMATLSLLSLVYVDARQPFSLHSPLIPPSPGPFITGSLGRWDRLTVGVNGDVHSLLLARKGLCELKFRSRLKKNLSLGWTF